MTSKQLRGYIKAWITDVLITGHGYSGLKIITANQNAPAPKGTYITMDYFGVRDRIGRASKGELLETESRLLVSDWRIRFQLRESNGDGDLLRLLLDSLDREDMYHKHFVANSIAHLNSTDISPVPRLNLESWVRESMVEMQLGAAEGTRENAIAIETVEYNGDIGGLQE